MDMDEFSDDQILPSDSSSRSAIGAAFASAAVPGSGQFVTGQKRRGAFLFGILVAIAICFWPLRIGAAYYGYCGLAFATVTLFATSSVLALRTGTELQKRASWSWLLLSIPVALVCASVFVYVLMLIAGLHAYKVVSSSMEPTIFSGDSVVTDLHAYRDRQPQRGDLVVFRHKDVTLIKRLIGLPGDSISSNQGIITRNGLKLDEPYAVHEGTDASEQMQTFTEAVVPKGELFVLGDNRNYSLDSRLDEFGQVTFNDLRGSVLYVVSSKHDQTGKRFP